MNIQNTKEKEKGREEEKSVESLLQEILQKEEENKQLMISLNTLIAKNKNDTKILLNKTSSLSNEIQKIRTYIKWRRISRYMYWFIIFGSLFGLWYFVQNFLSEFLNFFSAFAPENFTPKGIIDSMKEMMDSRDSG